MADDALLVAARGADAEHGLYRLDGDCVQLATGREFAALARNPSLPVVYAISEGVTGPASVTTWRLTGDGSAGGTDGAPGAEKIGELELAPGECCHVSVRVDGKLLAATNYEASTITLHDLDGDGVPNQGRAISFTGDGPETDRQDTSHPHQAVFLGDDLVVVDLGSDQVRVLDHDGNTRFEVDLPAGTGPRHLVALDDGRVAVDGELNETLNVGKLAPLGADWVTVASTQRSGPAKTRSERNYPGDITRSPDGRFVFMANRGHDTIAMFDLSGQEPVLVSEADAGGAWPQHLHASDDAVTVACWDDGVVTRLSYSGDGFGLAAGVAECPSACWLCP